MRSSSEFASLPSCTPMDVNPLLLDDNWHARERDDKFGMTLSVVRHACVDVNPFGKDEAALPASFMAISGVIAG